MGDPARLYRVTLVRVPVTTIELTPLTDESAEWILRSDVAAVFHQAYVEHKALCPLVRDDPNPWEATPPSGVSYPALVAAAIQAALRRAYRDEEIYVWSQLPPGWAMMAKHG